MPMGYNVSVSGVDMGPMVRVTMSAEIKDRGFSQVGEFREPLREPLLPPLELR